MTLIPELIPPGERLMGADLAEQALEGLARAPRYAVPEMTSCAVPVADVQAEDGHLASQLIYGENFEILFRRGGRAFGRSRRDGAVGWVVETALKSGNATPAYRVRSHGGRYPFNALVSGAETDLGDAELTATADFDTDLVAVARGFLGMPVAAGARAETVDGVGLVQQVLFACGRAAPRRPVDLAAVGRATDAVQSGDIIVWVSSEDPAKGHAAIASGKGNAIHACANSGKVVEAEIAEVIRQATEAGLGTPIYRRSAF